MLLFAATAPLGAQVVRDSVPGPRLEGRVDALMQSRTAIEPGIGFFLPVGTYVRLGAIAGIGAITGPLGVGGRVEIFGRFLLDPLAQH